MPLTPQQARLQEDLRGLIEGEVRCDPVALQLYSSDASLYESLPQAVVWPRSNDDVVACVRYAAGRKIPVHPRGAGTGTMGGALGNGIVLDFTRFMRRILKADGNSVRVQPGAVRDRMNAILLRTTGRIFGPDPGFGPTTTIGSVIAGDGAGPHWLKYGSPRDHLLGCKVVLADGEILDLKTSTPEPIREMSLEPITNREVLSGSLALARGIVHGKASLIAEKVFREISPALESISRLQSPNTPDRSGYRLEGILRSDGSGKPAIDLARLFMGSEGTLGIITEAHVKTVAPAAYRGAAIFLFDSLEKATRSIPVLLAYRPVLCELIDRRRILLVREWDKRFQGLLPPETEAAVFVEFDGGEKAEVDELMHGMLEEVRSIEHLSFGPRIAFEHEEQAVYRDLLEKTELALYKMPRNVRAIPLFGDFAVATDLLHPFFQVMQNLFKRHEITASFSGHIGHGHVRILPILDVSKPGLFTVIENIVHEVYAEVIRFGGTISSESVCGIGQTPFLEKQFPELYPVFENIKRIFDPEAILNPDKVVPKHASTRLPMFRSLIYRSMDPMEETSIKSTKVETDEFEDEQTNEFREESPPGPVSRQLELQLNWNPDSVIGSSYRCNGCGRCRSRKDTIRMCPIFRFYPEEEAAPRAKANLLRGVLEGDLPLETLTWESSRMLADYCIQCQMCRTECPSSVDTANLAFRCKSAYVSAHGLPLIEQIISNCEPISRYLSYFSCPSNWMLKNRTFRWLFEKIFDLPQGRKLPRLAAIAYLLTVRRENRQIGTQEPNERKVALFLDTYANFFDTRLAEAAVRVLEHNGITVHIPGRQRTSGRAAFANGHLHLAEYYARKNVAVFSDYVRQGYEVVTIEPSSAVCLSHEYRQLYDDPELALIAEHTSDICRYLHRLHLAGELRTDFTPIKAKIAYHAPCRSLVSANGNGSLETPTAAESLLRLIPDLEVHRIERGCCGMAGGYGLKKSGYSMSLRLGTPLFRILRNPEFVAGASECNACKMQMEQGTQKPTINPVKLLALAYGLLNERENPLNAVPRPLVVT